MESIGEDAFVEPDVPPEMRVSLRGAHASAVGRTLTFYGERRGPVPVVVFCASDPCRVHFTGPAKRSWKLQPGARAPAGTYVAGARPTIIVVRTDAIAENVLAHEMSRLELQFRVSPGQVPTWFDDGVATYVGREPECPKDTATLDFDLVTLERNAQWIARTNDPGARVPIYCRARLEVATWLDRRGQGRLLELLSGVHSGRSFDELYRPAVTEPSQPVAAPTSGALAKEAVNNVVRRHLAGVKYCYEKELKQTPGMSGSVDMHWTIAPDGHVIAADVIASTFGNDAVETCILRQVRQWVFPSAQLQTNVDRYPFIFKGGN